jgi:hypothetical protein
MMYGDSNVLRTFRIMSLLHADNLAFADNLGMNPVVFIWWWNLEPEI